DPSGQVGVELVGHGAPDVVGLEDGVQGVHDDGSLPGSGQTTALRRGRRVATRTARSATSSTGSSQWVAVDSASCRPSGVTVRLSTEMTEKTAVCTASRMASRERQARAATGSTHAKYHGRT